MSSTSVTKLFYFYPRSPCGERHWPTKHRLKSLRISIHALLAESDAISDTFFGEPITFLSTLSLRRATYVLEVHYYVSYISIHALLAESDA